MMNKFLKAGLLCPVLVLGIGQANAAVVSSEVVLSQQQYQFNKQQVLSYVDSAEAQNKLVELGVTPAEARQRIAAMTPAELHALNTQMNEMPAGSGVVGTIITVMVVVAVLDVMGITDVYPFIDPI